MFISWCKYLRGKYNWFTCCLNWGECSYLWARDWLATPLIRSCVVCCESSLSATETVSHGWCEYGHVLYVVNLLWALQKLYHMVDESMVMCCMLWIFSGHYRNCITWLMKNSFSWSSRHVSVICIVLNEWKCFISVFLLVLVLMSFIPAGLTQGTVLYCGIFDLLNKCQLCYSSLSVYMDHMRIPHLSLFWWFMSIFCGHSPSPRIIYLCSSLCWLNTD